MKAKLSKDKDGSYTLSHHPSGWGIGSTNHEWVTNHRGEQIVSKLSIKNCEAIERGYDLDELADIETEKYETRTQKSFKRGFLYGFQKALELMETEIKQLREFTKGFEEDWDFDGGWNCIVEMEYVGECNGNNGDGCFQESPGHNCGCFERKPKLDADGCLILKRIP